MSIDNMYELCTGVFFKPYMTLHMLDSVYVMG